MAKNKSDEFKRSVKNFYQRMYKYRTIKGTTFGAKFYELEDEIRAAKRGEINLEDITNKLNEMRGDKERELVNIYNPILDRFTPLGETYEKDKKYKHNLYEVDVDDVTNIIADNPDLFKSDDVSQEYYEEYNRVYEDYDTTLLKEVWDWLGRKPVGIVAEIQFDLAQLIRQYGEKVVAYYINERQDDIPLLNSNTGYDELTELLTIISDISNLISIDENKSKSMSEQAEQYEKF